MRFTILPTLGVALLATSDICHAQHHHHHHRRDRNSHHDQRPHRQQHQHHHVRKSNNSHATQQEQSPPLEYHLQSTFLDQSTRHDHRNLRWDGVMVLAHKPRYIVTFADDNDSTNKPALSISSVADQTHAVVEDVLPSLHGAIFVDNGDTVNTQQALKEHPSVLAVVEDFAVSVAAQSQVMERMGFDTNPTISEDTDCAVDADVAVIDTGIDLDHPYLNVVMGVNCLAGTCQVGEGMGDDDQGHGTFVAGIIGAKANNGIVGVAPGVRLWSIKVLNEEGRGWASDAIKGIEYVLENTPVKVVNFSFGGLGLESEMCQVLARAVDKGITFASSAGNNRGRNVQDYWPANCQNVLSVGSMVDTDGLPGSRGPAPTCGSSSDYVTDVDDSRSFFSNIGANITAIGSCVQSTLRNGGYGTASGTSMASPAVAGALAILTSQFSPSSSSDVQRVYKTILANAKHDWLDGPEPRLDVSNGNVFAPKYIGCSDSEDDLSNEDNSSDGGNDETRSTCFEHPEATFKENSKKGSKPKRCEQLAKKSSKDLGKYCREGSPAMLACPVTCEQCGE